MDAEERARIRRTKATSRITRLHEDDGSFDREFWARYTPSERMEMCWDSEPFRVLNGANTRREAGYPIDLKV